VVALNPNWPLMAYNADFTQGPPNVPGANAVSLNAPSRRTAVRAADMQRGRQYELDQVQAGTCSLTVVDPLEQLHPSNGSSPFNTGGNTITSYRCVQVGAWWNPASQNVAGNLLNTANPIPGQPLLFAAYGWDPSWESWFVQQRNTAGTTYGTSTDHLDGTHTVWKVIVAAATNNAGWIPRLVSGATYTATVDVWAATSQAVTIGWNGSTPVTTAITGNNAFQSASVTFTPTAADITAPAVLYALAPSGSFPVTFYVSNWQLAGAQPGWSSTGAPTTTYATVAPRTGQYHLKVSAPASSNTVAAPLPTVPGVTYTVSAYVQAIGAGTVAKLAVGAANVSTVGVGSYQRLAITFTATDAITTATWSVTGSGYPAVFYVDDIQLEATGSASAYTTSGPTWYPLYTGYIERYPLQWDMQGTRGIRPLTCVDALSILSRTEINQSYAATIAADAPYVAIPYSDQALPQTVQLPQGGTPFLGYQNLGTQGAVSFGGDTFLDGASAVTVTQQNATPPVASNTAYITYLGTNNGAITMLPQSFTIEVWVKAAAGAMYLGAGAVPYTEAVNVEPFGPSFFVGWYTSAGRLNWYYNDPTNAFSIGGIPASGTYIGYPDGQWHYLAIRLPGANGLNAVTDNVIGGTATITPTTAVTLNNFFVDCQTYTGDPVCTVSVANWACYPTPLTNAQLLSHYNRGAGYINEVSGARVARLLAQYWSGATAVAAGKRQMAPDYSYNSRFVLDVLQEIQETERGLVYASAAGVVVFEDSVSRYKTQTALWVFGENPAGASPAEYPYLALEEAYDPTYTFSQTNLTRPANSAFGPLPHPLPTNPAYGQRVLSQQVQVNTDFDLTQASIFYLSRYGAPVVRVDTLTLDPSSNPALWPVVLSLEISQRVTVKRRTSAGLTTTADYYIEQIGHHIDGAAGTWTVSLQCSPVFNSTGWILGDATYGVLGTTTVPVF
jgi:hypothetical protein